MWFFGIAQWSLFVEKGKEFASNFIWGYNISLHILFLFCTIEFFIVLKSVEKKGWWKNAFVKFTFILFLSHLMSGIFYFARIISGGTYR
jgi:hypothetical protein